MIAQTYTRWLCLPPVTRAALKGAAFIAAAFALGLARTLHVI